jgi:hypothetical protein
MANWANPQLTSTYTNFVAEVKDRDVDLALQFDGTTSSSIPTNAIRWDSTANRWKKWNGSSWAELTGTYALTGLSTTGAATIGTTLNVTGQTTLATATATTPATGDNSTNIATTAHIKAQGYAPLASPTFTGTVTIPSGASIAGYLTTAAAAAAYPTLTGSGASGTWGINVTGSSYSSSLLSALGVYAWNASTLPNSYEQGITSSFVQGSDGFPNYGSVVTVKTYSGGGGSLQLFVPYGPSFGGTGLQARFGNYEVSSGNSWTSWKTLLASDNYTSYSPTLTGTGASGTWGISVTGSSASCTGNAATANTASSCSGNSATATTAGSCTGNAATATALTTASGSAPSYSARAWVNFNGTGTVAIRSSGNVSSITDNGVGDYTVNFTTAMPDANYAAVSESNAVGVGGSSYQSLLSFSSQTASSVRFTSVGDYPSAGNNDKDNVSVAIFR